jgi:hypothetical protein
MDLRAGRRHGSPFDCLRVRLPLSEHGSHVLGRDAMQVQVLLRGHQLGANLSRLNRQRLLSGELSPQRRNLDGKRRVSDHLSVRPDDCGGWLCGGPCQLRSGNLGHFSACCIPAPAEAIAAAFAALFTGRLPRRKWIASHASQPPMTTAVPPGDDRQLHPDVQEFPRQPDGSRDGAAREPHPRQLDLQGEGSAEAEPLCACAES